MMEAVLRAKLVALMVMVVMMVDRGVRGRRTLKFWWNAPCSSMLGKVVSLGGTSSNES